jgi:amidase
MLPKDTVGAFVPHTLRQPLEGSDVGCESLLLSGATFASKDLYHIEGRQTGAGNPTFLEKSPTATVTSPAVLALLNNGASCVGITVCDELFYSVLGDNIHYGTPLNSRAPGHLPGGSSSGSASAVAAGLCDFGLGSDTAGSVRIPASFCGLLGFRPTHGRIDLSHATAMSKSFDTCGWFTRGGDAELFAKVGEVLFAQSSAADSMPRSEVTKVQKILVGSDVFGLLNPSHASTLRKSLARVTKAASGTWDGLKVEETVVTPPGHTLSDWWNIAFRVIQAWDIKNEPSMVPFVQKHRPQLAPAIQERIDTASKIREEEVKEAIAHRATYAAHIHELVRPGYLLCIPTAPCTAPAIPSADQQEEAAKSAAEKMGNYRRDIMAMTSIAGLSGLPEITLPLASDNELGHPLGLSFVGWPGSDELLLQLAVELAPLLCQEQEGAFEASVGVGHVVKKAKTAGGSSL